MSASGKAALRAVELMQLGMSDEGDSRIVESQCGMDRVHSQEHGDTRGARILMKHVSAPPKSRRVKPHYEHVVDPKQLSTFAQLARGMKLFINALWGGS